MIFFEGLPGTHAYYVQTVCLNHIFLSNARWWYDIIQNMGLLHTQIFWRHADVQLNYSSFVIFCLQQRLVIYVYTLYIVELFAQPIHSDFDPKRPTHLIQAKHKRNMQATMRSLSKVCAVACFKNTALLGYLRLVCNKRMGCVWAKYVKWKSFCPTIIQK